VPSLFYALRSPALTAIVPKWSPKIVSKSFRSCQGSGPGKSPLIVCIAKFATPFWSISPSSPGVFLWVQLTHIGNLTAPTSKIISGPSDEGFMKDADRTAKRKPLTIAEVREAYEPLGEKYPPLLDLDRAADLSG
jgi:hypothetical protein